MKYFFVDNASTTKVFPEVKSEYQKFLDLEFYNPSALYKNALSIKKQIDNVRQLICDSLGANGGTVVFTSGATEANNLALNQIKKSQMVLIGGGEHPSIFETAKNLVNEKNINLIILPLLNNGQIDIVKFKQSLSPDIAFVSVMLVSNETGIINDIKKISLLAKKANHNCIIHTDSVQAFMKIPFSVSDLGVDMCTISSHKINGVKGVGALWVREGLKIKPQIIGGGQENGVRSGTENTAGICAFGKAIDISRGRIAENYIIVQERKNMLISKLEQSGLNYVINGDIENSSPYILSVSFIGIRGEVVLHLLDESGVLCSTGSACSTKKISNRTLQAMGKSQVEIEGNLRFSFSAYENFDADFVVKCLINAVSSYLNNTK